MTVIDLAARRAQVPNDGPALGGVAVCMGCRHEWSAVAPTGTTELECPACGAMKGVWKFFCMPTAIDGQDAEMWTCGGCGGQMFSVAATKDGPVLYCSNCGHRSKAIDLFDRYARTR